MMKKYVGLLLVYILLVVSPCTNVLAIEAEAPVGEAEEVFMTLDEFLELFERTSSGNFVYLKTKFLPYENEIAVDRFYSKLRRIEGAEFEFTVPRTTEALKLPLYSIGDIFVPSDCKDSTLINIFRGEVLSMVGIGIAKVMDFKYESIAVYYKIKGQVTHGIILIKADSSKFDVETDIGIALDLHQYFSYDKCEGYTYPTEDEYYAKYSGKSTKPTATPKPTSAPKVTNTPTPKPTNTPKPTPTNTPTPTATNTPTPTSTPTPSPTNTPIPTPTNTPTPTPTNTPTPTPTNTPTPTPTNTPTPTPTNTPIPTPTNTPTPMPTNTPTPAPMNTPIPTPEPEVRRGDSEAGIIVVASGIALVFLLMGGFLIVKRKKK